MARFYIGTQDPDSFANDSDATKRSIGTRFTFQAVDESIAPLAPEKTGLAAQPVLIDELGVYLSSTGGTRRASLAMWSSNGSIFIETPIFTAPDSSTPTQQLSNVTTPRIAFPGLLYTVGFNKWSSGTYYWAGTSDATQLVRYSTTYPIFNIAGAVGFAGVIAHSIGCDTLPSAPLSLAITASDLDIELTWDEVSDDGNRPVTGYVIQRSTNNINWTTLSENTNSTVRIYNDNNLTPGFTYYYRVAAINLVALTAGAGYWSPYSNVVSAVIGDANPGNAQSLLTATVANPDPLPLVFSDIGPGIRFTQIDVQYGAEYLYTQVEATTQDSLAELQLAEAPESKELYGVRTYSITNLLNSDDLGAFQVAKDYLTYYYQPELRVESITVNLANLTLEQKLQVLELEIDGYISVSFTPNGIGDPKITSGLVTSIGHRITLTSHEVELRLRNERTLFTLDSASKGILDVNILGP
jgi:hypothetical protein